MPEPLTIAAISIALKELAGDAAKDLAKDLFKEKAKDLGDHLHKSTLEKAAAQAIREFLRIFEEEIDSAGGLTFIAQSIKADLKKFLAHGSVRAILREPFDPDVRRIDGRLLGGIWKEIAPTALPREFSWENVGQQYVRAIRRVLRE